MTDGEYAYIVRRTIENKIAFAENNDQNTLLVTLDVLKDILDLLKEKEPKPPIVHENSYGWKFYYCPNCEKEFYQNRKQAYCEKCGQAVKWDDWGLDDAM